MLLWIAIRCFYHIFCLLTSFFYGFPSIADTTIEMAFVVSTLTVCTLHISVYCHREAYMSFLNQMIRVNKCYAEKFLTIEARSRGRHWNTGTKYTDGVWPYMKLMTPCMFSSALTFGVIFLSQPHKRLYYYSYLVGAQNSIVLTGLYFLLECYTLCWMFGILFLLWYTQLLYANSTGFWLKQIT